MVDFIASPWPAYALLLLVTLVARLRGGSWFAPAAFVGLVWTFFIGGSLFVVDYPIPARGMWMLVLLILSVQLGALLAHELRGSARETATQDSTAMGDLLSRNCSWYALVSIAIALIGCVYFLFTSLEEFGLPFTPMGVLEVGAKWTLLRYDDAVEPWSVRLLVTWLHPAALLGGILFAFSRKRRHRMVSVLTLLPAVLYGILTGARAAILLGLTCWIGGYVAAAGIGNHRRLKLFSARGSLILIVAAVCSVGVFAAIDAVRDSSWRQEFAPLLSEEKLSNFIFGSPAAFAAWYARAETGDAEWGARTFAGEFDLLRVKTRTIGRYTDTSNVVGEEVTNIYTIFRGLIEDFSDFGAILVSASVGGFAGWIYFGGLKTRAGTLLWMSAFYATFLYSPIISIFSFNGVMLAWVIGWFVLTRPRRHLGFPSHPQEVVTP